MAPSMADLRRELLPWMRESSPGHDEANISLWDRCPLCALGGRCLHEAAQALSGCQFRVKSRGWVTRSLLPRDSAISAVDRE
jgi:hypothetical protein